MTSTATVEAPIGPTLEQIRQWPATVSVEHAGSALGYSKSWAYQLIAQNEFPCRVLRQGNRVRVFTASLIALLEGAK